MFRTFVWCLAAVSLVPVAGGGQAPAPQHM
jgi:hypothetical protein